MAQVKIPAELSLQYALLLNIITQNNEPGFDSPLTAWLLEKKINLDDDKQAGDQALLQENIRVVQEGISKKLYKSRNNNFKPVFKFIRGAAQVLKNFYPSNYATLTQWSIPITDSGRIDYPSSFEDQNSIASGFFQKLAEVGITQSPLAAYIKANNINVAGLQQNNSNAAADNTAAIVAAKAAENATEQRNGLWKDPVKHIHEIADYLKTVYPTNPRALGDWGYVVDNATRKPVFRKSKLAFGQVRTVTGVILGSILTNTGKVTIIIYKGKSTAGQSLTLKPGDKMGILKGYSNITVQNTSTLEIAEFTLEIAR